ncbi:MAG: hypothetical protein WC295_10010 [Methanoregula sp.]
MTKIVIILSGLFAGIFLIALVVTVTQPNNYQASNGLGMLFMSLGWVLVQAFLIILVIILISMAVTRIKAWIEKYLDGILAAQKAERENAVAALAVMNEKMGKIEKKLENIERILDKVAE